jgi:hypothetical protein
VSSRHGRNCPNTSRPPCWRWWGLRRGGR